MVVPKDRVECRGLRPGTLPHHRTCGFPHPAVELSGASPQGLMASGNRWSEGPRCSAPFAYKALPRLATHPGRWRPILTGHPSPPDCAASAHGPFGYATAARTASGCPDVSSLPAGKSVACPQPVGNIPTSLGGSFALLIHLMRPAIACWSCPGGLATTLAPSL
jgi:hypothetical protein